MTDIDETLGRWRQAGLFRRCMRKHSRAGVLMMRPWIKERTKKKWMRQYEKWLHKAPMPPDIDEVTP